MLNYSTNPHQLDLPERTTVQIDTGVSGIEEADMEDEILSRSGNGGARNNRDSRNSVYEPPKTRLAR